MGKETIWTSFGEGSQCVLDVFKRDLGFGQAAMHIDKEILAEAVVCCLLYVKTESFEGNGLVMVGIMVALATSFGDIGGGLAIVHCSWFEGPALVGTLTVQTLAMDETMSTKRCR
ncbi:hypothetical protein HHK36_006856 [Tetracentron sinense]|uniref:Uncharacterized protein n=1 Tax=Tetracentron sinense TaxID=13715 RepID=A0A834ZQI3_TETSI|nr:hypothetical protein HHK36_006856 [Tetracentron sinense]